MSLITPRTLKGFRDLMPPQARRREHMVQVVAEVFRAHGYGPIETPVLEYAEILKGKQRLIESSCTTASFFNPSIRLEVIGAGTGVNRLAK